MRFKPVLFALICIFALGNLSGYLFSRSDSTSAQADPGFPSPQLTQASAVLPAAATAAPFSSQEERDIAVFREISPSVVYISNIAQVRQRFSLNVYEMPQGTGSGFVWDQDGHIVTNYHVLQGGDRFTVTLGEEEFDAVPVGVAPRKDLAVLRIEAPRRILRAIPLGSSSDLQVGQRVLAIGNPFGLDQSLTTGVVSALGRELQSPAGFPIRGVIQSDAAINPGNSGGPLLDSSGRLIGVNTAIYSPSGASAGIGFAVPVDTVRQLVPQLIEFGQPIQPGIGIDVVEDRLARRVGVRGVIVRQVMRDTPAERAGIEGLRQTRGRWTLGDVIVAIGDKPVESLQDLVLAFEDVGVGGTARLTLERDRQSRRIDVQLIALEPQ